MKTLEKLKLVALPEKASLPPAQVRRQKFLTKLDEQIAMFKAEQAGHAPTNSWKGRRHSLVVMNATNDC